MHPTQEGFDIPEIDPPENGPIETAALATVEALRSHGALDATHTLKVELIKQGARALDREFHHAKVTVAAMTLYSKVIDIADGLPTIAEAVTKEFAAIVKALEDA